MRPLTIYFYPTDRQAESVATRNTAAGLAAPFIAFFLCLARPFVGASYGASLAGRRRISARPNITGGEVFDNDSAGPFALSRANCHRFGEPGGPPGSVAVQR
ncbi:hypothetical protein MRX96_019225 [Rhipicephalus microplus]